MNKQIYLVDVSSLFFRAFYAVRPLTSPQGVPVNAVYGFLSMILKLIKEKKPQYLVFCYDRKEPSFRKDIFPDYKANRSETPQDLIPQIPYMKKLAEVLGIPSLEKEGFEADDLIGTLTRTARQQGFEVFIVSGDKDFGQVIAPHVWLVDTMKDVQMGPAEVIEKWGVSPEQFIDYLAIVGDTSDNVPGIRGIGPKGAVQLLKQFGTLENIYQQIDQVNSASLRKKLEEGKDQVFISKKLVTIVQDVPVSEQMQDYQRTDFHHDELRALLHELNFKNFEKTIFGEVSPATVVKVESSQVSNTSPMIFQPALGESKIVDLHCQTLEISQLSEKVQPHSVWWYLPFDRGLLLANDKTVYLLQGQIEQLEPIFQGKNVQWKSHDLKKAWQTLDLSNQKAKWDSMLAAYVLDPGTELHIENLFHKYLGQTLSQFPEPEEIYQWMLDLEKVLTEELKKKQLFDVLEKIDLPLVAILQQMEKVGVKIDRRALEIQSKDLVQEISSLEKEIWSVAGQVFNIASPKQLAQILFEKMKLPVQKKTKTGYSTDNEVLEKLKDQSPLPDLVLKYREFAKLKSTYVDALPLLADGKDRVHSHFNQALTTTGRLSSSDPNLQNIPIRTERGSLVRKAFIAEEGNALLSLDYSQIELRILAHVSEDPGLIRAFADDLDIHTATASEVFGIDLKAVTSDQRRTAKAINFGIAYGQGAFGLSENLGISRSEASEIIRRYFTKFPQVQNYIESTIRFAYEHGYVQTLFGRRRYLHELQSKNAAIKKFGERAAINAPMQGTASDLVKKAMINIAEFSSLQMILQVHDELIFEGPESQLKEEASKIQKMMESVVQWKVPLKVHWGIGPNWDQCHS